MSDFREGDYDQKAVDVIRSLSHLVRRLCYRLKKHEPDSKVANQAIDYLLGEGLQGSILRGPAPTPTFALATEIIRISKYPERYPIVMAHGFRVLLGLAQEELNEGPVTAAQPESAIGAAPGKGAE